VPKGSTQSTAGHARKAVISPPLLKRQSEKPAAAVAISFSLGIALSQLCRCYSFGALAAGTFLLIGAAFIALAGNRNALSMGLAFISVSLCGTLTALAHRDGFSDSDLRFHLSRNSFPLEEPVFFEGCVIREGEVRGADMVSTISMRAFRKKDRWIECKGNAIVRMAPYDWNNAPARLMPGDRLTGWASWRRPRNFGNPGSADIAGILARRGIFLTGRIKSHRLIKIDPGACSDP